MRILNFIAPAAAALVFLPGSFGSAFAESVPTGIWMNDTGRGAVEIKPCGNSLCGNVVWVKSASDASGCGKQVIGDVAPVGGGRWDNGWIYSPEKDRKYDVELTPLANGNLKVMGYAGMKFLSKTMIWKPAPKDLQLCGQTDAKAVTPPAQKPPVTTASISPPAAPQTSRPTTAPAQPSAAAAQTPAPAANQAQAPAASPDQNSAASDGSAKDDATASGDDSKDNDVAGALGKLKIGDLSLDKVLTKTKSGKCKLDTPWFKVTLDCPQEQ